MAIGRTYEGFRLAGVATYYDDNVAVCYHAYRTGKPSGKTWPGRKPGNALVTGVDENGVCSFKNGFPGGNGIFLSSNNVLLLNKNDEHTN
jgi:hypothetical protein